MKLKSKEIWLQLREIRLHTRRSILLIVLCMQRGYRQHLFLLLNFSVISLNILFLYKPLAIVSGDFYWVSSQGNMQIIIAADCTGHGVPGAFMSMLGVTMLNEIVNGKHIIMPDQIIENLRAGNY